LWDYVDVPSGDILIITGDIVLTDKTADYYLSKFQEFLQSQKGKFKDIFVIAGNHDRIIQRLGKVEAQRRLYPARYLENDLAVTSENITIFGSPWSNNEQRSHTGFQFSDPKAATEFLAPLRALEPGSVDVLLTHAGGNHRTRRNRTYDERMPLSKHNRPYDMAPIVANLRPLVNISGHYHSEYGITSKGGTVFANCASLNGLYLPWHHTVVIDIEKKRAQGRE